MEAKKEMALKVLKKISKKIDLRIVGSTVLKKHGLIDREPEDIDIVIYGGNASIERLKEEILSSLDFLTDGAIHTEWEDMYGDIWKEVEDIGHLNFNKKKFIEIIAVYGDLPKADKKEPEYCSRGAAIAHKRKVALLCGGRKKDFEDYKNFKNLFLGERLIRFLDIFSLRRKKRREEKRRQKEERREEKRRQKEKRAEEKKYAKEKRKKILKRVKKIRVMKKYRKRREFISRLNSNGDRLSVSKEILKWSLKIFLPKFWKKYDRTDSYC